MKKLLCLLLTIVCLLSACAFAESEAAPSFAEYSCARMEFVCDMVVEAAGGERPYTGATEIPDSGVIFSNDDASLTCILYSDETESAISGGTIYTTSADHVRNAMNTLCILSLIESEHYEDGIALAAWFDENYDSVIELFYNPELPMPEDPNDALHTVSFTGEFGLSVTMDTFATDSGCFFTISFS